MVIVWITLFTGILICIPVHFLFESVPVDILIISIHCLIMLVFLMRNELCRVAMITGFVLRLLMMMLDCTTLVLSDMNKDATAYYYDAVWFAQKGVSRYGGMYSKLLGYLFRLIGSSRALAAYINVLLGMMIIWFLYKCLMLMNSSKRLTKRLIWLLAVFPYSIYGSCITYRETVIAAFVTASAYFAFKWYKRRNSNSMILCVFFLLIASIFHAGIILLGIGYAILFILYSQATRKFQFNRKSIFTLCVVTLCIVLLYVFPEFFLGKLRGATAESIVNQFNYEMGGSAYLSEIKARSLRDAIIFSPLKLIYFLFSPLPTNWRGLIDVIPFFIDSIWYFICLSYIVRRLKRTPYHCFVLAIGIGWVATAFVFGIGTWTAGTAIRHRNKIFAVLLMLVAASSFREIRVKNSE